MRAAAGCGGTALSTSARPPPIPLPAGRGSRVRPALARKRVSTNLMTSHPIVWLLLLAALLVAVAIGWFALPARQWVEAFDAWIAALGPWGVGLFALVYVAAVVLLAPAELLSIAAGFLFGAWGFPIVIVAATIGAALAFLVSRYAVRARLRRLLQD